MAGIVKWPIVSGKVCCIIDDATLAAVALR